MTVKNHYRNHLGGFYAWMTGDFKDACNNQYKLMKEFNLDKSENNTVLDLGAGHGIQSVTLAKMGYNVTAVDFNEQLLSQLSNNTKELSVTIDENDIRNVLHYYKIYPGLICCCGDTIAHLDSVDEVGQLIMDISSILVDDGAIFLSFRDYSNILEDTSRFIPVRSDNERIHTCFLEYFEEKVKVTDILHTKNGAGWEQKASSYFKVRITVEMITDFLIYAGMEIEKKETIAGMVYIKANKLG